MDVALHILGAIGIMLVVLSPTWQHEPIPDKIFRLHCQLGVVLNAIVWPAREWMQNGPPWEWGSNAIPEALAPVAIALILWGLIELWRKA